MELLSREVTGLLNDPTTKQDPSPPMRDARSKAMPLDHYVTLGRSGLRVSPFCIGAMTFGEDLGWGTSVKESEAILDRFIELGGNFIDTANLYTKGHSEKIVGDHLGRHKDKRDRLVIATKFSANMYPRDPNGGGSNRKRSEERRVGKECRSRWSP